MSDVHDEIESALIFIRDVNSARPLGYKMALQTIREMRERATTALDALTAEPETPEYVTTPDAKGAPVPACRHNYPAKGCCGKPVEKDTHTEHCCRHACKYGRDSECTVRTGNAPQSFVCDADCGPDSAPVDPVPDLERARDALNKALHRLFKLGGHLRNRAYTFDELEKERVQIEEHVEAAVAALEPKCARCGRAKSLHPAATCALFVPAEPDAPSGEYDPAQHEGRSPDHICDNGCAPTPEPAPTREAGVFLDCCGRTPDEGHAASCKGEAGPRWYRVTGDWLAAKGAEIAKLREDLAQKDREWDTLAEAHGAEKARADDLAKKLEWEVAVRKAALESQERLAAEVRALIAKLTKAAKPKKPKRRGA